MGMAHCLADDVDVGACDRRFEVDVIAPTNAAEKLWAASTRSLMSLVAIRIRQIEDGKTGESFRELPMPGCPRIRRFAGPADKNEKDQKLALLVSSRIWQG